jgi:hypothetical protein
MTCIQLTRTSVLQLEVFILEFESIDTLATSAIMIGEITTLAHELRNNAVKNRSFVAKTLLTSAKSTEVL